MSYLNCEAQIVMLKSTMRPAEWKYQSFPTRWIRLDACISIDQSFSVPAETKHMPLLKEIQVFISNKYSNVDSFFTFIQKD